MSLSIELRKQIIEAYEQGHNSLRQLAKQFRVSPTSVCRLVTHYKKGGDITPKVSSGRKKLLSDTHLFLLQKLITKKKDITLQELRNHFIRLTSFQVSVMTIHRARQRLSISYKK